MMERLNVITPVSREYNIPAIFHSIEEANREVGFDLRWIVVYDRPDNWQKPEYLLRFEESHPLMTSVVFHDDACRIGDSQRNKAVSMAEDGWIAFLDDDNLMHEEYLRGLKWAIESHPGKLAFVFSQIRFDRHRVLRALEGCIAWCRIDSAMFVVHRSIVGGALWHGIPEDWRAGDFAFLSQIHQAHPDRFAYVDKLACYHNFLRPAD